jgi:2-polyprenyl-6-methoxyphenol hydroxylase-like FAD-dependent oxidoreductase
MAGVKSALVIGGGIAGPVTALALQKAGIDATVYEAYAETADSVGGMLMLAPNGLNALRIVGADDVVRRLGKPIRHMVLADGCGKSLGNIPALPDLTPSQVLERSDLYRALRDFAVANGVRIEHGKRLINVDEAPDSITARFADGTAATGDVLIGADGIRSTVRKLIDASAPEPQYAGLLNFGGFTRDAALSGPSDTMYFVFGKRAFLGYWKHDGVTAWFSNLPHKNMSISEFREVPASEWLRILRDTYSGDVPGGELMQQVTADEFVALGAMELMPSLPHWYRDRMVLVGDSAHAPSSTSGQGASLAAESAIQLAHCLRDIPDVPQAFRAYERLRRPRVEKIAADAAKRNSDKAAGPVARALMSVLMPIAMKTFMTPEKMIGPVHRYAIDWNATVSA